MQENACKVLLKLTKLNELKFTSHLDWQNLILKTLRRTGVELCLSEGFSPTVKISFSSALPLFIESECELVSFISKNKLPSDFEQKFHENTNKNVKILNLSVCPLDDKKFKSLDILAQWARYEATLREGIHKIKDLEYNIEKCLSKNDMFIKKINKKSIEKQINIRKSIKSIELIDDKVVFVLKTGQDEEIPALRADIFLTTVFGKDFLFNIKRTHFFDKNLEVL